MFLAFLLSLHILLILIYALAIEAKKSRHGFSALIFAFLLPFAGELCLFVSEFGNPVPDFDISRVFKYSYKKRSTTTTTRLESSPEITRESLLKIIENRPDNMVDLLKLGLKSNDAEIVHLSASAVMKMQRDNELKISEAERKYNDFPENMTLLREYIRVLKNYYKSHLLEKELNDELLKRGEELLNRLLNVIPGDVESIVSLAQNYFMQGRTSEAIDLCSVQRKKHREFLIWRVSLELLETLDMKDEICTLLEQSTIVIGDWKEAEIREWKQFERRFVDAI